MDDASQIKISRFGAYKQALQLCKELEQTRGGLTETQRELEQTRGGLTQTRRELEHVRRELGLARSDLDRLGALPLIEVQTQLTRAQSSLAQTNANVATAEQELAQLKALSINVRSDLALQAVGLYDFEHPAEDSVELRARLEQVRADIKACVRNGDAWTAADNFMFNGSEAQGRKFINDLAKMMLSAYNAEAENAVKTVKAGSVQTAIKRIRSIAERIAKYGSMIDLAITPAYMRLREAELTLTAKHLRALERDRAAERERKADLREQAKAEAELKRERERLEAQLRKERDHYEHVIAQLQVTGDLAGAAAAEAQMLDKIADVNKAIEDVDYRRANQRAGYVYVISNIGSLGERMVKIGMTRRLEPMDRVRELGDASVPFRYDVHAMFFSEDAPGTEAMLHRAFEDRRVNKVNPKREFFYCTPQDVLTYFISTK